MKAVVMQKVAERYSGLPLKVVELSIGVTMPILALLLRFPLEWYAADRAPYAFNFVAALIATVFVGWRGGVIATFVGQALIWFTIIEDKTQPVFAGLLLATTAQFVMVFFIHWYKVRVNQSDQNHAIALKEIDHRTKNNYQLILSLLTLQGRRASPEVRMAFESFGARISALALVTEALRGKSFDSISIKDHLCNLCRHLEGALSDGIPIECDVEEVPTKLQAAVPISLIINELVTNALKYAFPDRRGVIEVWGKRLNSHYEIVVRDNGIGIDDRRSEPGLGSRLVDRFVRQIHGTLTTETSEKGTLHRIEVPIANIESNDNGKSQHRES